MKIAVFAHTFPKFKNDSTAAFMEGFCEGLQKIGHQIIVLIPFNKDLKTSDRSFKIKAFKYILPLKLHIFGFGKLLENGQNIHLWALFISPFYFLFAFFSLLKLVKKKKIDIISAHWIVPGGFIASLVSYITRVPLVISAPGADIYLCKKFAFFRLLAKFASLRAKAIVVAGSPLWIEDLASIGIKREKLYSVNYGVDVSKYYPLTPTSLKKKIILSVGRLIPRKGMDVVIKAMARVIKKHREAHLVIVGDGEQRKELEFEASKLKVFDHVLMAGSKSRDDLLLYYNMCDIYVACSNRDKAGTLDDAQIALLEAMACKKAVIVSSLPGNKLVVKDNVNGYVFPQGDDSMLAEKINLLIEDKEKRDKFAGLNLKLANEKYSTVAVAEEYNKFLSI